MKPISTVHELWVGLQVSVKQMISVRYTHLKEWALESLRGPRQGFRVECDQPLNNTVNDIVLTSRHAWDLEDASRKVRRKVRRRNGGPSPAQPIGGACELWVGLQALVKRM